ncbi:MAG: peptidylprolyl isomerase [Candidatus Eiseniibacteriota bacterium]
MTHVTKRSVHARVPVWVALLALGSMVAAGCASKGGSTNTSSSGSSTTAKVEEGVKSTTPETTAQEPEHIKVQHILIGFVGSVPGKNITRTKDEAKTLAYQILERAQKGEDFDTLVKQNTDDAHPGIYGMSNKGVTPATGEYPRDRMVPAFGNVGFKLAVGGVGIADYDPATSPYGYHVIKRVE